MRGQFKRSAVYGIVGVFVAAGLCVWVALTMGQPGDDPKPAYALIFGIVGAYVIGLFVLQRSDLGRAEAASTKVSEAVTPDEIANPAVLDDATLWTALAVRPIDEDAIAARKEIWAITRSSWSTGVLVTALIFIAVPPIYLFDTWIPFVIGTPLIVLIALWKSVALLAGGGDLGKAYEASERAMAPLGLSISERLKIGVEPRSVAPLRFGPRVRGATVMEGERHGRAVRVRMPAGEGRLKSEVQVAAPLPSFEFKSSDGRLKVQAGAPAGVERLLAALPASERWNGVKGEAGEQGIEIERRESSGSEWLLDLWLAERLADATAEP